MALREDARVSHRPRLGAHRGHLAGCGTTGNELLTAATGALLIVLLAVLGVTLLRLRQLLWVHLFVGMLLIGPIALKLASTGYRFVRYYTGDPSYRRKGPPPAALRALAPILVFSTVAVLASGVALLLAGPSSREALLPIHKISFIIWAAVFAVHVLAHLPSLPRVLRADYRSAAHLGPSHAGRGGRWMSLALALFGGLALALATIPLFAAWLNAPGPHQGG
jgi:hypothetical protein